MTEDAAADFAFPAPSLRRRVIGLISAYPAVFIPAYRRFGKKGHLAVRSDTELVIEGYPRSANSFAVVAFAMAQDRPVRIAHHLHAAAQVKAAVRDHLPCVVLIRHPVNAVASLLVRERGVAPAQAIEEYVAFYRAVEPVKSACVIGRFEIVTTHYEEIIRAVNYRFGTTFREFVNDTADVGAVFAEVERLEAVQVGELPGEHRVARPSVHRQDHLLRVRQYLHSEVGRDMSRAATVYERFLQDQD